jgi:hypothetical protein
LYPKNALFASSVSEPFIGDFVDDIAQMKKQPNQLPSECDKPDVVEKAREFFQNRPATTSLLLHSVLRKNAREGT